jgi:pimeloyl-ACP methyl ester carboxylesterase
VELTYPRTLDWTPEDYSRSVETSLINAGIRSGWLLGESFGSIIAWRLLHSESFAANGLILAGGFVRHPSTAFVRLAASLGQRVPTSVIRCIFRLYALATFFCSGQTSGEVAEFIDRRTSLDRQAMRHRLRLIAADDPRTLAREIHRPVFQLAAVLDFVVPWWSVCRWLRVHCPGYRATRLVTLADHNVLGTAPRTCSRQILNWISRGNP